MAICMRHLSNTHNHVLFVKTGHRILRGLSFSQSTKLLNLPITQTKQVLYFSVKNPRYRTLSNDQLQYVPRHGFSNYEQMCSLFLPTVFQCHTGMQMIGASFGQYDSSMAQNTKLPLAVKQKQFLPQNQLPQLYQPQLHQTRHYSTNNNNISGVGKEKSVEKRLLQLMDMWEMEKAVKLLQKSVREGVVPHPNVVLNLQQQLANLGEVECLLQLHDFLTEHKLTSDARFFLCLQEAYYNSGRIDEGVAVLRLLYHRTRKFSDVEIYFTLLSVMVLNHFPERLDLIKGFVVDLKDAEVPVLEPGAALWKCFVMTERWSDADELLLDNEGLRSLLPQQVARICQGVDKAKFDEVAVLSRLMDLTLVRQRLRVFVADTLMDKLVSQKEWPKLLKSLKKMKSLELPLKADKLNPVLDDLRRHLTPQYDSQIDELKLWCESLQTANKLE